MLSSQEAIGLVLSSLCMKSLVLFDIHDLFMDVNSFVLSDLNGKCLVLSCLNEGGALRDIVPVAKTIPRLPCSILGHL